MDLQFFLKNRKIMLDIYDYMYIIINVNQPTKQKAPAR
nr:MAG TPA: hypothetical protein [Caudoviricetes sp.]